MTITPLPGDPPRNCPRCPRLAAFRSEWRSREPYWHNAPVPTFAPEAGAVRLLVVGLAPGLRGANRTGRPFTGDFAGDLLYETLLEMGFACGTYDARADDRLKLIGCAVTNATRCVPPDNKPLGAEVKACRQFLARTIAHFDDLRAVLVLGRIAHDSTVRALGGTVAQVPFGHGVHSDIGALRIFSSYHCSRYNTNTGRLTPDMFRAVFHEIVQFLRD